MSKYIFLSPPAYGHVNPTLPVVQELVRRGEQVGYYLTEEFRSTVEATGASFHRYESIISIMSKMQPPVRTSGKGTPGPGAMPMMMVEESREVLPQILDAIHAEQPDVILYDAMCLWGRLAVQVLKIPAVSLHPSYAEHFNLFKLREDTAARVPTQLIEKIEAGISDLCAAYNLPPTNMHQFLIHAEALNIVFLPRDFQPAGDTFDERFVFVGPSLLPRQDAADFPFERLGKQPVLYISLGTVFNNRPDFFQLCFQAFGEQPYPVVLAHGKHLDVATLGTVPPNFLLSPYVPQLEVLQRASIFITHGGMNSTMESLYYGVPMVVLPQMLEQELTARRIAELSLGIALDQENLTAEQLREAVGRVLGDPVIAQRVQSMQQTVRAAGGYLRATDAIIDFATKHPPAVHS